MYTRTRVLRAPNEFIFAKPSASRAVRLVLWLAAAAVIAAAVIYLTAAIGVPEGFDYVG
jgi:hypothetical protein